jgi:hypothetical protein
MMTADETPAGIRQNATRLTMQAVYEQLRAVVLSGEWAELGYDSVQAYVDEVRGPYAIRFDAPDRRERVAELSAAGVPVTEQAALLGVHKDTITEDRKATGTGKPARGKGTQQVSDVADAGNPAPDDEWPEDDLDADPPESPEVTQVGTPPRDPAAIAAARAALEADRRAAAEKRAAESRADRWHLASDAIRVATEKLGTALGGDPWTVALPPEHGELLQARVTELTALLDTVRAEQARILRRVK